MVTYYNENDGLYYTNEEYTVLANGGDVENYYYINGVRTDLDVVGRGFWNGKAYYDGNEQPTGYNGYFYYINNIQTDLNDGGTGFWDGKAYLLGQEKPTGWNNYYYYINNVQTTLDHYGDGIWNEQNYIGGLLQNNNEGGGEGSSATLKIAAGAGVKFQGKVKVA